MNKNKINIEITADGWKTDVTINGKTYSERYIAEKGGAECVEGNFEEEDEIPESIYSAYRMIITDGLISASKTLTAAGISLSAK